MSYNIELTDTFNNDLLEISLYISIDLQQPNAAANLTKNITDHIRLLGDNPYLFKSFESEPWHSRGWRYFPVNNYLVFYSVNDTTQTVKVIRVVYGARNIEQLF